MNAYPSRSIRRFGRNAALAAALYCVALTTPAAADYRNGEPLTKVVNFADLYVSGEPGARMLHGRLRMAATQVCAPFKGGTLRQIYNWRNCVDQALARAVEEINQPQLTAYHLRWAGKTEAPAQIAKDP